jgi:hypothetical protein
MNKREIKTVLLSHTELYDRYHIKKVGLFGSYAQGKQKKGSDIDLLVEFKAPVDLFEYVHLSEELRKILKIKIDLATPASLKPHIRDKVLKEVEWFERN